MARSSGYRRVIMESDSQVLIRALEVGEMIRSNLEPWGVAIDI